MTKKLRELMHTLGNRLQVIMGASEMHAYELAMTASRDVENIAALISVEIERLVVAHIQDQGLQLELSDLNDRARNMMEANIERRKAERSNK